VHEPHPRWAFDIDTALKSVHKLTRGDIGTVICYLGASARTALGCTTALGNAQIE
jgi:hypothetical protein